MNEEVFLRYIIDCCENILENEQIIREEGLSPPVMQLVKLRAEVTERLKVKCGVKYGKFADGAHLLKKLLNP